MIMFKWPLFLGLLVAVATLLPIASAHRPALRGPSCDEDYGSSTTAMPLADPTISWSFRHYLDCTHRAVWVRLENPTPNQPFYVGVGIPTKDRFAAVRANALIIGPELPALTAEEWEQVPEEIRNDPVWSISDNMGAYFHSSPEDQSTCNHLGIVMQEASTVVNDRCDFYEPFGSTHSWRVLDADNNLLPEGGGATYYVAVFLQDDTSAKLGIALGTWVENFITQYDIATPTCDRNLEDFSEKQGLQDDCFPAVDCPTAQRPIGCEDDGLEEADVCELGQVCSGEEDECVIAGIAYEAPTTGACGGELCPAAVQTWEEINAKMHEGMMDIEYMGNPDIDFVRGMIPHHNGALDMCQGLVQDLTCTTLDAIESLEGLVHFCNHVKLEQEIEVGGMLAWLAEKTLTELAPCNQEDSSMTMARQDNSHNGHNTMMHMTMSESCGNLTAPSSEKLIDVNIKMHELMAVKYSCDHSLDFVRMMLPHHAGAVDMCDILLETTQDDFLIELCDNITVTQRAEIAWMYEWLEARDMVPMAPCSEDCVNSMDPNSLPVPCEDTLSASSFCHGITGQPSEFCRCDEATFTLNKYSCEEPTWIDGFGLFVPAILCKRFCGQCPTDSRPLWVPGCPNNSSSSGHHHDEGILDHDDGMIDHGHERLMSDETVSGGSEHYRVMPFALVLSVVAAIAAIV